MIMVVGAVTAQAASFDELRALAQQHVERSRGEPGCVSHAMSIDSENPLRLVFVEEWADFAALQAHFAVPESRQFAAAAARLGHGAELRIFDAKLLRAGV
jgi:quinol monooxygenase YgiN